MKLHALWNWQGTLGRGPYVIWGLLLAALKWNLDRFLFDSLPDGRPLQLVDLLQHGFPAGEWFTAASIEEGGWRLLLPAIPFLYVGVMFTVQRLRSARLPLWLAVFFVVPVLKWLLFPAAALAPRRELLEPPAHEVIHAPTWLERLCPRSRLGSAMAGVGLSCALLWSATLLGTQGFRQYGWGLFLGLPFIAGFLAAFLYGTHQQRPLRESLLVAVLAVLVGSLGFVALAIEGVICIVMAAPLAVPLALVGAMLGHVVQPSRRRQSSSQVLCIGLLAVPLMLGGERLQDSSVPLLEVRSSLDVAAAPERVWANVVSFGELPTPTEWLFRLGIAHPLRADMFGKGPGAVRHCVFSTGPFVEPIEVWDEPRLLRFGVTKNPPPMEEWTPYQNVHPPHLDGFLASERGQFQLLALPDGGTRLEGTTWYRHNMWPVSYWQTWSDHIIHRIHLRVLTHIKARAEAPVHTP